MDRARPRGVRRWAPLLGVVGLAVAACDLSFDTPIHEEPAAQHDGASARPGGDRSRGDQAVPPASSQLERFRVEPVELFIWMEERHLEELYTRSIHEDFRLPGTYRVGRTGEIRPLRQESIRFRGDSTRHMPKKSFNIRFDEPIDVLDAERINLNAMYTDPSLLREHLTWRLFAELGRPASRTAYVDLYLNDVYEGLFLYVQRVDEQLLTELGLTATEGDFTLVRDRSKFDDDDPDSVFGRHSEDLPTVGLEPWIMERFDWRAEPDWSEVTDLVRWGTGVEPGDRYAREIAQRFDLDVFVDWLAVHMLVADVDAYGDDYWLYLDSTAAEPQWVVLPWDHDLSFGSHYVRDQGGVANHVFRYEWPLTANVGRWDNRLVEAFLDTPTLRGRLEDRLMELMRDVFSVEWFEAAVTEVTEAIRPSAGRQPGDAAFVVHRDNHYGDPADRGLHVQTILDFVELRYAYLEARLTGQDGPRNQASVDLTGLAPGERVLLTDAHGWTIAAIDLSAVTNPGVLTVTVEPSDLSADVDRAWTLTHTGGVIDAELSLYYRNHPEVGCGLRVCENWFRPHLELPEFVTGQHSLEIVEVSDSGFERLESAANPYANRVTARTSIEASTTYVLVAPTY